MTDRYPTLGLATAPPAIQTVAALAPIVAPTLARTPGASPILAHHEPDSPVAFGAAGDRSAEQLRFDVARVAAVLPDSTPDDPREILCVASDRYHFTVALLAAWQRGHTVALPPNAQPELLRAMSDDPAISLVIHDTDEMSGLDLRPLLTAPRGLAGGLAGGVWTVANDDALELAPLAAARHLVSVWTSGSTGEHQRHSKTAGQLFAEALVLAERFGLAEASRESSSAGVRVVATVPSHHIYGLLFSVLVPLVSGGAFLRETPLHAGVVRAALEHSRADVLVSVPAHLRALRILDPGQLPALSRVFSSGAALPSDTARMLLERFGVAVTEILGSTETGGIAVRLSGPELLGDNPDSVLARPWMPLPHVQIDVDRDGRLLVDSPFLPPEGQRPWRTADRVELLEDLGVGGFRHLGRIDGVVKVGGKRVALAEIERRLLEIPGVEDAAATVISVEGARGQEIVALVVAPGLSPELLRAELRRWLDPVVVPRRLRLLDALPREANGKLPRKRLLEALERPTPRARGLDCTLDAARSSATRAVFQIYVPRDLYALRGHFRGAPIVPGVQQLELARSEACSRWPDLGGLRQALRVKFVRPVRPGERLQMVLERRDDPRGGANARVDFTLTILAEAVASGTLVF
jgi:acyl-coenzyme A synthetase/AMP-(fatty) acid ligase/3-hydroxymyristoyl/3-hydroxydecanoyl-(acyl carrier protein) dehydratase